jgi:hypothetical protein
MTDEGRECRGEETAELLERGPALTIEQARTLEVPPHRLELTDRKLGERSGPTVVLCPGEHLLAGGDGLYDGHRTVQGGDRKRAEEAAGCHLIAGGGRMSDRTLSGGGRVTEAGTGPVHVGEQAEGPHQSAVIAHRLKLGNLMFHELNHALLLPDAHLHGVRVGRVAQLQEGECRRPGDPHLVGGKRPIHRLGQHRLGPLEFANIDRRLAGVEQEQRPGRVVLAEQGGGPLQQVRRRGQVTAD